MQSLQRQLNNGYFSNNIFNLLIINISLFTSFATTSNILQIHKTATPTTLINNCNYNNNLKYISSARLHFNQFRGGFHSSNSDNKIETNVKINNILKIMRLSQRATIPFQSSLGAAGYDLSSAENQIIPARGKAVVKTDLAIALPDGTYGRIAPRSGLSIKNHLDIGGGVIDADYRGNIGVILFNHAETDFEVKIGDRIAQLILEKYVVANIKEVNELDGTKRGSDGFGSTG